MLEWVVKILEALAKGRFTGSVNIRFKDGGISSITRPKASKQWDKIAASDILTSRITE